MSTIRRTDRNYWDGDDLSSRGLIGHDSSAGLGPEAKRLNDEFQAIHQRWNDTYLYNPESLAEKFERLKAAWMNETALSSSLDIKVSNKNYLQIIGLGPAVLPYILNSMRDEPAFWFMALYSITGEDPVDLEQKGNVHDMTVSWLNWGRSRGLC